MSAPRFNRCPKCGEPMFADVSCTIGPPVNRVIPCYLSDIVLDQDGQIVAWQPGFGTLAESLDFDADDYEPEDVYVYCEDHHDPVNLVRALQTGTRFHRGQSTSSTDAHYE